MVLKIQVSGEAQNNPPEMSKNDFFDKNDYKTNSEWKLQLTLGWYLSPTIDFDNMIHITAFLKPIYLRGNLKWPLKCWKMMFLTKVITKNNSNSKLWPILAGYLTLILHFNNMIQDAGEPKITPLNCQKMFLTQTLECFGLISQPSSGF